MKKAAFFTIIAMVFALNAKAQKAIEGMWVVYKVQSDKTIVDIADSLNYFSQQLSKGIDQIKVLRPIIPDDTLQLNNTIKESFVKLKAIFLSFNNGNYKTNNMNHNGVILNDTLQGEYKLKGKQLVLINVRRGNALEYKVMKLKGNTLVLRLVIPNYLKRPKMPVTTMYYRRKD